MTEKPARWEMVVTATRGDPGREKGKNRLGPSPFVLLCPSTRPLPSSSASRAGNVAASPCSASSAAPCPVTGLLAGAAPELPRLSRSHYDAGWRKPDAGDRPTRHQPCRGGGANRRTPQSGMKPHRTASSRARSTTCARSAARAPDPLQGSQRTGAWFLDAVEPVHTGSLAAVRRTLPGPGQARPNARAHAWPPGAGAKHFRPGSASK